MRNIIKAFEKILERLDERKQLHERMISYEHENGTITEEYQAREAVDVLNNAKKIVQEVAEQYNNGWIPCSERLPENIFTVIIQVKEMKKPTFGWYENITGWILTEQDLELKYFTVIAWQPLPEPYKESESE